MMLPAHPEPTTERMARRAISLNEAGVAAEEILVAWLIGLPVDADVSHAALQLAERLGDRNAASGADDGRLRDLLLETARSVAGANNPTRGRNRLRN